MSADTVVEQGWLSVNILVFVFDTINPKIDGMVTPNTLTVTGQVMLMSAAGRESGAE
jgi:hypothetical protein